MRDDKKQQSIRAARDWLDEADASLSKGSGIRGDLKVMLAQAELRHAQEAEPEARSAIWRRRLARLLPLTAAVLAALAFYLTPAVAPPQETAGIPAPPAEMQAQPADGTEAAAQPEAAVEPDGSAAVPADASPLPAVATPSSAEAAVPDAGSVMSAASSREAAAPSSAPSQAAQPAAAPAAPAVPAPETQKLMQTAGKALREP